MTNSTTDGSVDRWVPADRRFAGMDRKTLLPAGIVLASAAVMHWGIPWVDSLVPYEETVPAGQTMTLGAGVQFTPPAGWGISQGILTDALPAGGSYPDTAAVFTGSTSISVTADDFSGTPEQLLEQIRDIDRGNSAMPIRGAASSLTTASGIPGVISEFQDVGADGAIAAFIVDGVGIEVVVRTPADTPTTRADLIGAALSSIQAVEVPA
ncbi:hypothetical protein IFT77_07595 [Frigoribacterium sp. CFBP 13729]|uniref:hypothetical protein n=1 Tax=unclassified Frigoribacterium TaxID=2627005 RepID=UPI00178389ED|nr:MULTISPECIES: hypothetical protein [unclassified Frigoribacterium]MBD8583568.1 hypothetical protein [Frigoribacterium sp. CFBP 8766]MBD8610346.1 hypothetical protein [Frigoribacterium sp. CFBP 13729]